MLIFPCCSRLPYLEMNGGDQHSSLWLSGPTSVRQYWWLITQIGDGHQPNSRDSPLYIYMHACMHAYIHTYIHTYNIHTYNIHIYIHIHIVYSYIDIENRCQESCSRDGCYNPAIAVCFFGPRRPISMCLGPYRFWWVNKDGECHLGHWSEFPKMPLIEGMYKVVPPFHRVQLVIT